MSRSLGAGLLTLFAASVLVTGTATAASGQEPAAPVAKQATSPSQPDPSLPTTKQPWEAPPPATQVPPRPTKTIKPLMAPAAPQTVQRDATPGATPIIIDTDIFSGVDDAGALAEANAMQDNGIVNILGVLVNNPSEWGAPAVSAIDHYYNHDNIQIGSAKPFTTAVPDPPSPGYAQYLAQNFPNAFTTSAGDPQPNTVPDAGPLYRKLLAGAADHSVVIVAIGYETNLSNLLNSPGDASSPLNGKDLVAQKVKSMVVMGGTYPSSGTSPEHNFRADVPATQNLMTNWPTSVPVEFEGSEVGDMVYTGAGLAKTPDTNPVKAAYTRMIGAGKSESSYDPIAMYYAAEGAGSYFTQSGPGWPVIDGSGGDTWGAARTEGQDYYMVGVQGQDVSVPIEALMDQLPGSTPPPPTNDAIQQHYQDLGGATGFLGTPVGGEQPVAGGLVQEYTGGNIYWSQATGAWSVHGAILAHYKDLGGPTGELGFPRTDETGTPDGIGRFNHFQGPERNGDGSIYWTPNTGAHEIQGAIRAKWASLGWETSPLRYPKTDESTTPDGIGRFNHFSGADGYSIYWTPGTGAHEIQGAIRAHWAALGWERGPMGYPKTDELGTPDGIGRYNHFTGGDGASIYWTPGTGAWSTHGAIRARWSSMGWEQSGLGYPTSDEYGIAGGRANNYQHGTIQFFWSDGSTRVIYR